MLASALIAFVVAATAGPSPVVRLPNGLRVLVVRDTSTARFALVVAYGAGFEHDPPNRAELAHFTEHTTFRPLAAHFDSAVRRGAQYNAVTRADATIYWVTENAAYLEFWLWLESQRMSAFGVGEADAARERTIVSSELEQRESLEHIARHEVDNRMYPASVRWPSLSERQAVLDRLTVHDARWFHRTFYRPRNAVVVIRSPIEPTTVLAAVRRYFGTLESPSAPPGFDHSPDPSPLASPCQGAILDLSSAYGTPHVYAYVAAVGAADEVWKLGWIMQRRLSKALSIPAGPRTGFHVVSRRTGPEIVFRLLLPPKAVARDVAKRMRRDWPTIVGAPLLRKEQLQVAVAYRMRQQLRASRPVQRAIDSAHRLLSGVDVSADGRPASTLQSLSKANRVIVSWTPNRRRRRARIDEVASCD